MPAQDLADGAAGAHDGRALLHGGAGVPAALDLHPRRGHHRRPLHPAGAQRLPMHASFSPLLQGYEGAARVFTLIQPSVQEGSCWWRSTRCWLPGRCCRNTGVLCKPLEPEHAYRGAQEGSLVEKNAVLAPGTVLPPGRLIPGGQLWAGNPARYVRDLTKDEARRTYCDSLCFLG